MRDKRKANIESALDKLQRRFTITSTEAMANINAKLKTQIENDYAKLKKMTMEDLTAEVDAAIAKAAQDGRQVRFTFLDSVEQERKNARIHADDIDSLLEDRRYREPEVPLKKPQVYISNRGSILQADAMPLAFSKGIDTCISEVQLLKRKVLFQTL